MGFRSNQERFKVVYAEIPIATSVLWMDSLRTSSLTGELNRMLVGQYSDPDLGKVSASAYTQFRPADPTIILDTDAEFDSAVLQFRYDFYSYGTQGQTVQKYSVHEITEELEFENEYFFNSDIDIDPTSIGMAEASIDGQTFNSEFDDTDTDPVISTRITLDNAFGQRLFNAIDPTDTLYTNFLYFKEQFKGIAVLSSEGDKVLGLSHLDTDTYLRVYYHSGSTVKAVNFVFAAAVTFSKFDADRSATELAGLNSFFTDYSPASARYVQSGTSLVTKLDLTKYYDYIDTIPNIVVNSAELVLGGVDPSVEFKPLRLVSMSLLDLDNRYNELDTRQDTLDFISFNGLLKVADLSKQFVSDDQSKVFSMSYSTFNNSYSGFPTLFFQQLFTLRQKRYPYWAIVSNDPPMGKAVTRTRFSKDDIKLRIYYSRSTPTENP